jgi:hypothetical protein
VCLNKRDHRTIRKPSYRYEFTVLLRLAIPTELDAIATVGTDVPSYSTVNVSVAFKTASTTQLLFRIFFVFVLQCMPRCPHIIWSAATRECSKVLVLFQGYEYLQACACHNLYMLRRMFNMVSRSLLRTRLAAIFGHNCRYHRCAIRSTIISL